MKQILKDDTAENINIFETNDGYIVRLSAPKMRMVEDTNRQRLRRTNSIIGGVTLLIVAVLLVINDTGSPSWFEIIVPVSGLAFFLASNFILFIASKVMAKKGFNFDFIFNKNEGLAYLNQRLWFTDYLGYPVFEFTLLDPFAGQNTAKIDENATFVVAKAYPNSSPPSNFSHLEFRNGFSQSNKVFSLNVGSLGFEQDALASIAATLNHVMGLTRGLQGSTQSQNRANVGQEQSTSEGFNPMD